jgi:hypothetical protein
MLSGIRIGAAVLVAACITSSEAHASDAVLEWNQIALAATVTAGQSAVPQIRSMAIVHVAMHDAVNLITRDYRTYLGGGAKPCGGSPEAAAIAAAHRALVGLFSAQMTQAQMTQLNASRAASLAARGLSEADPGIELGEAVAAAVLSLRANDGSAQSQFPYIPADAGAPGVWVPVGTAQPVVPGWGKVTPWVIEKVRRFRPEGPPSLRSRRYARDYNEVKEIGAFNSPTRTPEQTEIARFWLASPSLIWNGVARQLVEARGTSLSSTARVFALMYLAAADASIVCWDAKYTYNFWRPITAIQQGDTDGNDRTDIDLSWAPLFPTPQHPEYVSGHATNSSAMATVLSFIYGDDPGVPIVARSPTNLGFERNWIQLSDGVEEVIDARVYSGIHYRTSDEVGARVGHAVARTVIRQVLQPRRHRGHDRD